MPKFWIVLSSPCTGNISDVLSVCGAQHLLTFVRILSTAAQSCAFAPPATGSAQARTPIGELIWEDRAITLSNGQIGELSQKLYDTITGIQSGKLEDPFGWAKEVK